MNVRNLLIGIFSVVSLSLVGCGGGFSCSDKGKCANDTAPSQAAIDACNKAIGDSACGGKYKDLGQCFKDNEQCTSAGDADGLATLGKCSSQLSALESCCQSNTSSAACTAG